MEEVLLHFNLILIIHTLIEIAAFNEQGIQNPKNDLSYREIYGIILLLHKLNQRF